MPVRTAASRTHASPAATRPADEAHPRAPQATAGDRAAAPRAARRAVIAVLAAVEASEPDATPPTAQDAGQPAAAAAPAADVAPAGVAPADVALEPGGTPLTCPDAGQPAAGEPAIGPAPGLPTGMDEREATGGAPAVARPGASGGRPVGGSASCRGRPAKAGVVRARAGGGAPRVGVLERREGRDQEPRGRLGGMPRRGARGRLGGPGSGLRMTRSGPNGSGPPFGRRTGPPRPTGRRSARC